MCVAEGIVVPQGNVVFFAQIGQPAPVDFQRAALLKFRLYFLVPRQSVAQAVAIKADTVGYHHLVFNERFHFPVPHLVKGGGIFGVLWPDAMHFDVFVEILVFGWLHQALKLLHNLPVFHAHQPHLADACRVVVGRLKIQGGKGEVHAPKMHLPSDIQHEVGRKANGVFVGDEHPLRRGARDLLHQVFPVEEVE
jgi:hypothetical protein